MSEKTDKRPLSERGYNLLFNSEVNSNCLAVYEKDNLLYIVSSDQYRDYNYKVEKEKLDFRQYDVTIYNQEYGVFVTRGLPDDTVGQCNTVDFERPRIYSNYTNHYTLQLVYATALRDAFDNAKNRPDNLQEILTAGPPYFRHTAKINNQTSTVRVNNLQIESNISDFNELTSNLKNIDPIKTIREIERTSLIVHSKEKESAQVKSLAERANARDKLMEEKVHQVWDERLNYQIKKGDDVCTFNSNIYGNVESVSSDRVKVYVIGKANGSQGVFFSGKTRNFSSTLIEGYRWFNRSELGHCNFSK